MYRNDLSCRLTFLWVIFATLRPTFGHWKRGSITEPILITSHLETSKVTHHEHCNRPELSSNQEPSDSKCDTLSHPSTFLWSLILVFFHIVPVCDMLFCFLWRNNMYFCLRNSCSSNQGRKCYGKLPRKVFQILSRALLTFKSIKK